MESLAGHPDLLTNQEFNLIQQKIMPGEVLRWVGREPFRNYLIYRIIKISRLVILMILASLFATLMVVLNPNFLQNSIFNMLPVLTPIALVFLFTYFLLREIFNPRKNGADFYVITTRHAMILTPARHPKIRMFGPEVMKKAQIRYRKKSGGDIIFERAFRWATDEEGRSTQLFYATGFFGLSSVDEVYGILQQVQQ